MVDEILDLLCHLVGGYLVEVFLQAGDDLGHTLAAVEGFQDEEAGGVEDMRLVGIWVEEQPTDFFTFGKLWGG